MKYKDTQNRRHSGAAGMGATALLVFIASVVLGAAGDQRTHYFLLAGPLCGIAGGLAYGRRWGVAIVLALNFAIIGGMFALQDLARSTFLSTVVWTGLASGAVFWIAGGCAALALPSKVRFDGTSAFAIPGMIGGMAFQFFYGPGRVFFGLDSRAWWTSSPWEHLLLWLIAAAGGGWLFGARLDRAEASMDSAPLENRWGLASVACGAIGLAIGALYLLRNDLPLGLLSGLSPASVASDWFWSWGLLAAAVAAFGFRKRRWIFSAAGAFIAALLIVTSFRVVADPWKTSFNARYGEKLLREHSDPADAQYVYAVYTGNLILAQAALNRNNTAAASKHLLDAVSTSGSAPPQATGPDTTVARALLDLGERDAVLQYFRRSRELWPQVTATVERWEAAILAGRRPNFNPRPAN